MAITVLNAPIVGLNPAKNLVYWKLQSNLPNLVYFKVDVTVDGTGNIVGSFKYYPRPDLLNGCVIEVSQLLQNLLTNPFQPMTPLQDINWTTSQVLSVQLVVTEYVSSGGVAVPNSGATTLPRRLFWLGGLNPFEQNGLVDWFVNNNNKGRFLTSNKVQRISREFEGKLNFLMYENVGTGVEDVKVYYQEYDAVTESWSDFADFSFSSYDNTANNIRDKRYWNINVSYDFVSSLVGNPFINEYRVMLKKGAQVLDSVTYVVEKEYCNEEQVVLFWENSYGGWDSIVLFNPYFNNEITRTKMSLNDTRINSEGYYAEYNSVNGKIVYNKAEAVTNVNVQTVLKANTFDLTDTENAWLKGLMESKVLYLKYEGRYFPVVLEEKNFSTLSKRKTRQTNVKNLSFLIKNI